MRLQLALVLAGVVLVAVACGLAWLPLGLGWLGASSLVGGFLIDDGKGR